MSASLPCCLHPPPRRFCLLCLHLPQYLVDGDWICSPTEQVVANGKGFNNHRRARARSGAGQAARAAGSAGSAQVEAGEGRRMPLACLPPPTTPLPPCPPPRRLIQPTATFTWRSRELGGSDVLLTGARS